MERNTSDVADAVVSCERIAVEAAVRNTAPLPNFDEYLDAEHAAAEVTA